MKKGSILNDVLILLGISAIILIAGYFVAQKLWNSDVDLSYKLSYEQESKIGDEFNELVTSEYKTMTDNAADTAIQQIANRLTTALDSTQYRYRFTVLRNNQVNAFTIPGGNIYVFSGLIEFADTPEEVAAVLAHEIGHAEKRHVVTRLVQQLSISVILSISTGGDPALLAKVLQEILGNHFSREQESEADKFALELLEKANISPKNLALFFQKLNEKDMSYDENLEILMSHPHNDKRIMESRRYKTKNKFKPVPFTIDWKKAQESAKND